MDRDELNEIGGLLHIMESIAQNHPNLQGIGRSCQRRLNEIEAEHREAEAEAVEAEKQAEAERQAENYKEPEPGDPNYIRREEDSLLDEPIETIPDNSGVAVERRV